MTWFPLNDWTDWVILFCIILMFIFGVIGPIIMIFREILERRS